MLVNIIKLTAVGFEPTRFAPRELESRALDHSAMLSQNSVLRKLYTRRLGSEFLTCNIS